MHKIIYYYSKSNVKKPKVLKDSIEKQVCIYIFISVLIHIFINITLLMFLSSFRFENINWRKTCIILSWFQITLISSPHLFFIGYLLYWVLLLKITSQNYQGGQ